MGIRARIPDSWPARQKLSIPARPETFPPIQRAATAASEDGVSGWFLKQNIQRQMIHQHHYHLHNTIHISLKNKIIIFILLVFLLILLAIDKCNRASSLAISVSQHCERAFRTPFICLCAPYMKRQSLRRSIEPKEGHKTTGASPECGLSDVYHSL